MWSECIVIMGGECGVTVQLLWEESVERLYSYYGEVTV